MEKLTQTPFGVKNYQFWEHILNRWESYCCYQISTSQYCWGRVLTSEVEFGYVSWSHMPHLEHERVARSCLLQNQVHEKQHHEQKPWAKQRKDYTTDIDDCIKLWTKKKNERSSGKNMGGGWYCSDTMINLMFTMNEWIQMEERKNRKKPEYCFK